jgi:hypothetical protein
VRGGFQATLAVDEYEGRHQGVPENAVAETTDNAEEHPHCVPRTPTIGGNAHASIKRMARKSDWVRQVRW